MKTITITLSEEHFDKIVSIVSNMRGNCNALAIGYSRSDNPDLRAMGMANQEESVKLSELMDALHTNRIIKEA